jgi:hypothetical protein
MVLMDAFGHSEVNDVLPGDNLKPKSTRNPVHAIHLYRLPLNDMGEKPQKE